MAIERGQREPFRLRLDDGAPVDELQLVKMSDELQWIEHTRFWLPASFAVRVQSGRAPVLELGISYGEGELRCFMLVFTPRHPERSLVSLPRISLEPLVTRAAEHAAYVEEVLETEAQAAEALSLWPPEAAATPKLGDSVFFPVAMKLWMMGRDPYESSYGAELRALIQQVRPSHPERARYLALTSVYRQARQDGRSVLAALKDQFGWEVKRAKNEISTASAAGILPRTTRGKRRF